jgi:hypothetical protein
MIGLHVQVPVDPQFAPTASRQNSPAQHAAVVVQV